jgi:putative drug exporter of the RND superfamily
VLFHLGRLIHRRARWFVLGWVLLIVLGFGAAGGLLGGEGLFARLKAGDEPSVSGEARQGYDLMLATDAKGPAVQLMLDGVDPAAATTRTRLTALHRDLTALNGVASVLDPSIDPQGAPSPFVSTDSRAVLVTVLLEPTLAKEQGKAVHAAVTGRLTAAAGAFTGATATVGGNKALVDEINDHVENDLRIGEAVALPLSLVIMVVVFGGLLAAGLPIIGAIASIAGGLAVLLGFSYVIELDSSVPSVVSILGLGLCIDYGLLLVSRYREELRHIGTLPVGTRRERRSATSEYALGHTMGTAGRTVMFSGVTVAISLTGLFFFDASILRAVGAAGVSVVVVALLVALTLVPALLSLAGDRLIRPGITRRIPGLAQLARRLGDVAPSEGAFSRLAAGVQRRPLLVALGTLAVLLVLAWPVLGLRLVSSGVTLLPASSPQRQLVEDVAARFPGTRTPAVFVVARTDVAQLTALGEQVKTLKGVAAVDPVALQGRGTEAVAVLGVRTSEAAQSDGARDVVDEIRALPAGFPRWVTGESATVHDFVASIGERAPYAVGVVILATCALLFLMTGSVLVPLKALLMNVLSLGAAFGVLVWIFQQGHLEGLIDFTGNHGLDELMPALALAFAFGLSMDYEVFLLSGIVELHRSGLSTDEAVKRGLQRSGRIITSAAVIIVLVFAGFITGKLLVIKEIGVALAVAVMIDATLVRMLMVPATMTLLGDWNWWAPAPLRRLHEKYGLRDG